MYFKIPFMFLVFFAGLIVLFLFRDKTESEPPFANTESSVEPVISANSHESRDSKPAPETALHSIRPVELRAHLEFLADDLLEGRDTGTRGARLASLYIANQFEKFALKPVGENDSFYQTVKLSRKKVSPESEIKIEIDQEMISLKYNEDFLVVSTPNESGEVVTREVVFTGFGIEAPEYKYNDFENLTVENKFTVYVSGEPISESESFFDGEARTRYSRGRSKRETAKKMKAAGAIGIVREETLERFSWDALQRFYGEGRISLMAEKQEDRDFPAIVLHPEAAKLLFAGNTKSFEEIDKNAEEGAVTPFDMKKKIEMKIIFDEEVIPEKNVVALLEGSDSDLKSEVVVFTAHYDHVGIGRPAESDSIYNGAADNASGVSGLIEIAEAFSLLPEAPRRSLLFMAVTAEEQGLLGSEYYVDHPIFPLEKTVANLNFDIIGIGDTTGVVVYGFERSTLGDAIKEAADEIGLEIMPDELPEERIFYRSDHYSFAKKGIPAIFPCFGLDKNSFAEFSKYYHRPNDDLNLPFNYNYMKKHVQMMFLAGLAIANSDQRPTWTPGDEFEKVQEN